MVKKEGASPTAGVPSVLKNNPNQTDQGHCRKTTMPLFYFLHVGDFNSKPFAGLNHGDRTRVEGQMNTQTLVLTVLIFWLIMGLGFTSVLSEVRRKGGTLVQALKTNEAFFFILSLISGMLVIIYKLSWN